MGFLGGSTPKSVISYALSSLHYFVRSQWRRKQIRIGMSSFPSPPFPSFFPFPPVPSFPFPSFLLPFLAPLPLASLTSPSLFSLLLHFLSLLPFLFPFPPPSLRSRAPLFQLDGLGEYCKFPSGVWGGAPAKIDFSTF